MGVSDDLGSVACLRCCGCNHHWFGFAHRQNDVEKDRHTSSVTTTDLVNARLPRPSFFRFDVRFISVVGFDIGVEFILTNRTYTMGKGRIGVGMNIILNALPIEQLEMSARANELCLLVPKRS
jgi:hypothetical protein